MNAFALGVIVGVAAGFEVTVLFGAVLIRRLLNPGRAR
jgi:hypothetical protein